MSLGQHPADDRKEANGAALQGEVGSKAAIRKAIAIAYSPECDNAPRVTAQAQGEIAEIMLKLAAECGVPIVANQGLTELLAAIGLGELIPVHVYEAVALIYGQLNLHTS